MIQKKICMLGSFAVGKTSLVRRFVENMFSDKYLTTIGVKIDKKVINLPNENLTLIIWDVAGENGFHHLQPSYVRGMSGYFLVVDKTRISTLESAENIQEDLKKVYPDVPHLLVINKMDLTGQWDITGARIEELERAGWDVLTTSAKTGDNVENAFTKLAVKIVGR